MLFSPISRTNKAQTPSKEKSCRNLCLQSNLPFNLPETVLRVPPWTKTKEPTSSLHKVWGLMTNDGDAPSRVIFLGTLDSVSISLPQTNKGPTLALLLYPILTYYTCIDLCKVMLYCSCSVKLLNQDNLSITSYTCHVLWWEHLWVTLVVILKCTVISDYIYSICCSIDFKKDQTISPI
jgi:hypothetical protein